MKRAADLKWLCYHPTRAARSANPAALRRRGTRAGTSVVLLAGLVFSLALGWKVHGQMAAADEAKLRENRGKQIYIQGTSRSGKEILAYLGESSLEVPGSAMPCANCHGLGGEGKPEGGVDPSNLTWESLTKPYSVTNAGGRRRTAYTERG